MSGSTLFFFSVDVNFQTVIVTSQRYIFFFILISLNIKVLLKLHTNFQSNIPSWSGDNGDFINFAIFSNGCHLEFLTRLNFIILKSWSRKENPQKLTQFSSRSYPKHLVGKRTAQKDTIIDITSDSQVKSNFPYRWSPASLTFNNYFYLFLYLYLTCITFNYNAPHLKSPKNQNRRAALGRPAIKNTGGLQLVCGRPTLALSSASVPQTLSCLVCVEDS